MPNYLVTTKIPNIGKDDAVAIRERIVSAKNQAAALAFVASDTITVEKATIEDAMRLAKAGVEVEVV
jgi:hypothetical protein